MKSGGKTRDEAFRIALIDLGMHYEDTWAGKMDLLAKKKALLGERAKETTMDANQYLEHIKPKFASLHISHWDTWGIELGNMVYSRKLIRRAGFFEPLDQCMCFELNRAWHGHPAGSLVVTDNFEAVVWRRTNHEIQG